VIVMPEPMPNESRKSFMVRCMDDDKMLEQFSNSAQRYAVCNSYADKSAEYALDPEKGDRPLEDMIGMSEMIGEADGYLGMADDTSQANTHSVILNSIIEAAQFGTIILDEATVEAVQYGKPGKNDPRKTPAKPDERRKGSKKNKPGSAKKPNSKIVVSPATRKTIENKMKEHNKKGKGPKATMGALLTVFRRGAGAFSKSHAPNMSRNGWGVARVNAFLYLLRNGRPSNPNYKQDNDLLPKSHSRSKKASVDETLEAAEYQGKKVTLDKPFRMPKGNSKKFGVYTKNDKSNVVLVRFGDPNMEIRRDDDEARKNYRSRMGCDTPRVGPKWKANYWSCKMWEKGKSVKDYTGNLEESQRSSE
tara:strand:- start:7297 stop:8382 length:1086 start_codon:yes stop_codon:yes gene_type:complete